MQDKEITDANVKRVIYVDWRHKFAGKQEFEDMGSTIGARLKLDLNKLHEYTFQELLETLRKNYITPKNKMYFDNCKSMELATANEVVFRDFKVISDGVKEELEFWKFAETVLKNAKSKRKSLLILTDDNAHEFDEYESDLPLKSYKPAPTEEEESPKYSLLTAYKVPEDVKQNSCVDSHNSEIQENRPLNNKRIKLADKTNQHSSKPVQSPVKNPQDQKHSDSQPPETCIKVNPAFKMPALTHY